MIEFMIERTKYVCPYCGYDKVEMVLASYHCDKCGKRTSVYDEENRELYEEVGTGKVIQWGVE